ncbi:Crp/Fnr family transcriptional regulator [Owenweeksia hongkongensis]|uniref:Crp/Fnr family transcriptional regulator n=1 Tax=Owenweeksia hongkongensis TaxID=253245 RepID=UPI003A8E35CF
MMVTLVKQHFEFLFEEPLIEEILKFGDFKEFNIDNELMDIGQEITHFPLVVSGSLKVMTEDETGNELLLYYLEMGDTCAMTLQCCLKSSKSKIRVTAEDITKVVFIPVQKMEEWIVKYPTWRRFVFDSYNNRLNEMLESIDNLAFTNLEGRLYKYLKDKAMVASNAELKITHHHIAHELNSSRVVISRLMKKLEHEGKITQDRNKVVVSELI